MSLILQKDPIIEALCEFRFVPGKPWDWTVPGRVYERVQGEFPITEQKPAFQFEASQTPEGPVANAQAGIDRLMFARQDRSALLQVGPDIFAVNQLRPYRGWPVFRPLIMENLEKYWQAAQPRAIRHILLRYINRIVLPPGRNRYEDFLTVYPNVPQGEDQVWRSWAQRVEIVREDLNAILTFQAGSHHEMPEVEMPLRSSVILDIGFAPLIQHHLSQDEIGDWLDIAHEEIERMFFESITQRCREMFEPTEEVSVTP